MNLSNSALGRRMMVPHLLRLIWRRGESDNDSTGGDQRLNDGEISPKNLAQSTTAGPSTYRASGDRR
jgi:hypothetical protein